MKIEQDEQTAYAVLKSGHWTRHRKYAAHETRAIRLHMRLRESPREANGLLSMARPCHLSEQRLRSARNESQHERTEWLGSAKVSHFWRSLSGRAQCGRFCVNPRTTRVEGPCIVELIDTSIRKHCAVYSQRWSESALRNSIARSQFQEPHIARAVHLRHGQPQQWI